MYEINAWEYLGCSISCDLGWNITIKWVLEDRLVAMECLNLLACSVNTAPLKYILGNYGTHLNVLCLIVSPFLPMSVAHTSQCSENGDVGHCELGDMVAGICIMIATAPKMIKTSQGREDETPH